MTDIYRTKTVEIPEREIVRYLGYRGNAPDENVNAVIHECMEELDRIGDYRACRERVPAAVQEEGTVVNDIFFPGKALARNLRGCTEAFVFAATAGPAVDRRIAALKYTQPSKALIMDAAASAAIEAFCDSLNEAWEQEAAAEGKFLRSRFSPGYGDLEVTVQKDLLRILDAAHLAGITLTDSMMMIPRKSVSAIIGISDECQKRNVSGCRDCSRIDCEFRRQPGV